MFRVGDMVCFRRDAIQQNIDYSLKITLNEDGFDWNGRYFFNKVYIIKKIAKNTIIVLKDDPDTKVTWDNTFFRHATGIDVAKNKLNES